MGIKRDQVIAAIGDQKLILQRGSLNAQIAALKAQLEQAQSDLARTTGLSQGLISNLEHDRVPLGLSRAKTIARALHTHPAVLLFP